MNMGMETLESELAHVSVETKLEGNESLLQKENGMSNQESGIPFGSHGTDEPGKKEVNILAENSVPKDAVDEWPATKQFHTFYMVKYRLYDDQKTRGNLDHADKELRRLNQARLQVFEKLRAKKAELAEVKAQLNDLHSEGQQFKQIMDEKKKQMEPLHHALGKLRNSNTNYICSSEEELNSVIKSLQYRMQHESIPLSEEKKFLRDIKQLEGTREQVIANAATRAKIQDSLGQKEVIQDQVKLIGVDLDGVRKENHVVWDKIHQLNDEKKAMKEAIEELEAELKIVTNTRDNAYEKIKELKKQLDDGNAPYYENRRLYFKAKELAARKDVDGVRVLVDTEVDKFISHWGNTKAFRDDYERRILPSLDMRQLSKDGRMRNPEEKPLVVQQQPSRAETEVVAKLNPKQLKEEIVVSTNQKEKNTKEKESGNKVTGPESITDVSVTKDKELEKPEKDHVLIVKNEVDEAKLKELKREEEITKAKQALERKKKLAEKAAKKAAIKAQKEAEKKQKEREKKNKKKAAASTSVVPGESSESDMVTEPEKADEIVKVSAPPKTKEIKEKTVRQRGRAKGPDSLPKIILKRKKATRNYWVWAAAVAAILVVLLSVSGYYYLM